MGTVYDMGLIYGMSVGMGMGIMQNEYGYMYMIWG